MNVSMKWSLALLVTVSLVAHSGVVADTWLAMDRDVVGGVNCNASDTTVYNCMKVPGAPYLTACGNVAVLDLNLNQQWRDEHGTSTVVCTANQCVNVTKWKVDTSAGCTPNNYMP